MCLQLRVLLAVLFLLAPSALPAENPDFSGSYTLTGSKGDFKLTKDTIWTLKVIQSAAAIEVTKVMNGKPESNKYPLDGSEGGYVSSGGIHGKCKAQFKGKYLYLETSVTTHPISNGPAVEMHTKERWELSPDSKKLTIHTDTDFPNMPVNPIEPWSEIYTRN